MVFIRNIALACLSGFVIANNNKKECWLYRDDIGAFWGIKGYEEMVT
jgi:ubiquinol-cytochrome c reductase cytochrome c1 subunit